MDKKTVTTIQLE